MRRVFPGRALLVPALLVWVGAVLAAQPAAPPPSPPGPQVTGPRGTVTTPAAATGTAIMRGTVVAAETGTPVRRAMVRAMSLEPVDTVVATTDDQGRFELKNLLGGRYNVVVSKTGFVSLTYGQRRPNERGTPIEVAPAGVVEKLIIGLPRGGVITGRIVDETGEPLAEARVQVLRSQFMPGGRRLLPNGRGDQTDDQGSFRIHGLMPGDYVVSATFRGDTMSMTMPNGRPAPESDQGYAPTYFPGTPSVSDAQRITVATGQEVSGITFGLVPTRVSRISGRVVGGRREDLEHSFVMALPDDGVGLGGMALNGGSVQGDGTFVINGVPPGRVTLRVQPRGRPEEALVGVTTITVAGVDVDNAVIAMQRPAEVMGRIEFEGGRPTGVSPGQLRVQPVALDPASRSFMGGTPRTNDDFTFTIRGAVGPTLFRASGAPGWYLKAVEVGGDDVTDAPVMLSHGDAVRDVRVVLTNQASTLSGSVRDDRGAAVLDATVVLFPNDDTKWTFASRFIRTARPDTEGRFEMRGLPASTGYRLLAVQGIEDMQAFDPEFLAGIRDRAESLALAPGESKTIDVKLR